MNRFFRLALIALTLAALVSGIYWQHQRSASQRQLTAWEAREIEEAIPAAWDQSFAWDTLSVPQGPEEALEWIRAQIEHQCRARSKDILQLPCHRKRCRAHGLVVS